MPKYTRRTIQEGLKWESIWKETPLTSVYMQESEILTVMSNYGDDAEFSFGTGIFSRECTPECLANVGRMPGVQFPVWHHPDCPNHTISCCGINEQDPSWSSQD